MCVSLHIYVCLFSSSLFFFYNHFFDRRELEMGVNFLNGC
jgi:hypothetical protein